MYNKSWLITTTYAMSFKQDHIRTQPQAGTGKKILVVCLLPSLIKLLLTLITTTNKNAFNQRNRVKH